jgi:hypothetical protein
MHAWSLGSVHDSRRNPNQIAPPTAVPLAGLGTRPTGMEVFGVAIDPATQAPPDTPGLRIERGPLHVWCFSSPHDMVMTSVTYFQSAVCELAREISQSAAL